MDRNVPPDGQRAGTPADSAGWGSALFVPGRSAVAPGIAKGGGMKWTTTAERLALMPQFLEPLGLRVVDDIGDNSADED